MFLSVLFAHHKALKELREKIDQISDPKKNQPDEKQLAD
jgi:hypothetical protein